MDIHQLRVFEAAAKTGGFRRAGELLHLSQSTVSQHIRMLEEELGCPLFLRLGKRIQVTEAGVVLLQYAERVFLDLKNAQMAVRDLNDIQRGTVRLGVGPTTLIYRLPHALGEYIRRYPGIELIILAGSTEFLLEALRSQHIDLAIVMPTTPQPGFRATHLGREELVIVLNREHPLAGRPALQPADLATLRFILYEKNTAMQNVIDGYFQSLGIAPRITMEVENNEAIKSLVRVGLGATILPLCAVAAEPPDSALRVLRVKGRPLMRELLLLSIDSDVLPRAIRELSDGLVSALASPQARRARV